MCFFAIVAALTSDNANEEMVENEACLSSSASHDQRTHREKENDQLPCALDKRSRYYYEVMSLDHARSYDLARSSGVWTLHFLSNS
jgi:hypothetical protein